MRRIRVFEYRKLHIAYKVYDKWICQTNQRVNDKEADSARLGCTIEHQWMVKLKPLFLDALGWRQRCGDPQLLRCLVIVPQRRSVMGWWWWVVDQKCKNNINSIYNFVGHDPQCKISINSVYNCATWPTMQKKYKFYIKIGDMTHNAKII